MRQDCVEDPGARTKQASSTATAAAGKPRCSTAAATKQPNTSAGFARWTSPRLSRRVRRRIYLAEGDGVRGQKIASPGAQTGAHERPNARDHVPGETVGTRLQRVDELLRRTTPPGANNGGDGSASSQQTRTTALGARYTLVPAGCQPPLGAAAGLFETERGNFGGASPKTPKTRRKQTTQNKGLLQRSQKYRYTYGGGIHVGNGYPFVR